MLFRICSREEVEKWNPVGVPHVIISIHTPGSNPANPKQNEFTRAVLHLAFHDLDQDPGPAFRAVYGEPALMTELQARDVKDFVSQYAWAEFYPIEEIIVHCDAGHSRSPAVAAALSVWLNGDDRLVRKYYTRPNAYVYRTLLNVLLAA
jgi:predicted protein tyrosine phosphatase